MISISEAILIQDILIDRFGGKRGIRDRGLLESAIKRPYQTFDSIELYPNPVKKAAAIVDSLVRNHPFVDGNKRIGYVLMRLLLLEYNLDISAGQDEKYIFIMGIASGQLDFNGICEWIVENTIQYQ